MKLNIIKNIPISLSISAILVIISLALIFGKGFNYGIDFAGGNMFQIEFKLEKAEEFRIEDLNVALDIIAKDIPQLEDTKRKVQVEEGKAVVIIRTTEMSDEEQKSFLTSLSSEYNEFEILSSEKVGASIGKELKTKSLWSLVFGCIIILVYIRIRFANLSFGITSVIALTHDIIILAGVVALLGYEIDTPFIAAILTILGYSINATIVIFDRVRENTRKLTASTFGEIMDLSVNQTLTRSINTSLTTFLAILALLLFGGATLKTFVTTLAVGVVIGTFSSIFLASSLAYLLEVRKINKKKAEIEG